MSVNVCGARGWQARYAAVWSGTFRQAGSDFSRFADVSCMHVLYGVQYENPIHREHKYIAPHLAAVHYTYPWLQHLRHPRRKLQVHCTDRHAFKGSS